MRQPSRPSKPRILLSVISVASCSKWTATLAALMILGWSGAKGGNPAELPVAATAPCQASFEKFYPKSLEAASQSYQQSNNVWSEKRQHSSATKTSSPQDRSRNRQAIGRVYKSNITPHWIADNTHFWYRNDLPNGTHEYILVDAIQGIRRPAFDHERLAQALQESGLDPVQPGRLPIQQLQFDLPRNALFFRSGGHNWRCDLGRYTIEQLEGTRSIPDNEQPALAPEHVPRASLWTGPETSLTFENQSARRIFLFWLDPDGRRQPYGSLDPGGKHDQHTYAGHIWEVVDDQGTSLAIYQAQETPLEVRITGKIAHTRPRFERRDRHSRPSDDSPDEQWTAFLTNENVFIRSKKDGAEIQLSDDGSAGNGYGMLQWAPDGKTLIAFRIEPGDQKEVYVLESSPPGGGRAKFHSQVYPLPGDKFTSYELNLFDIASRKQRKPDVERIDFGEPHLRWNESGRLFTYQKVDRGHQRFRLIEIDSHTGAARNIIDETSDTFLWTAHTESLQLHLVNWLSKTNQVIYISERDGWRHLYLVDVESGSMRQITKGSYTIRAVDEIDEQKQQITFRASGKNPEQDPYFIHYYRIQFDGSGLVALTGGNGSHRIQYSPDKQFLIDTYSRVDMAPVHELRRTSDGKLICLLEQADITELLANQWRPPEVFVAKGRDGKTDIWGIICRPQDFNPEKKYPILEDIYAGPQSAYVPKTFSGSSGYASLVHRGFIVVKIDGMGTAHRSKAFHDVCWKNLKDAGFPDRILWIKAAAAKYPSLDTRRVGVFGNSAGGQNAAGAVLFHPEFYRAAVASCGCHDNRLDKASWNEQWMGYPVGPQYSECSNIENAYRLQGHLMLIVGEMDTNVPPENTMRLVDALIKADKNFDLLVIPGGGHGMGGSYGQRRMEEFFVRHLIEKDS